MAWAEATGRLTDRIGLGVLTRVVHRDLVDEVLVETGRLEKRRRLLPARVVVYFVLTMTLFFDDAYEEVMRRLVDGLRFLRSWDEDWHVPSSPALCKARARLGEEPVRQLFRRVAVPLAGPGTPGAWLAGRRLMAIDGVQMDIADTIDNEAEFGRGRTREELDAPYPKVKVVGLAECATHAIVDAEIGALDTDERELARPLLDGLVAGMLVIADRGFFSHELWRDAAATGADLLWRTQSKVNLPVIQELPDGSYLSRLTNRAERQRIHRSRLAGKDTPLEGITVRVVEYEITNRDNDQRGPIRLITTLLDPATVSAAELAAAYHARWEFETSLAEIETSQRGSYRVLRSHSPAMVRQEVWGLLTTHYAIRELMYSAADFEGCDPLRLSFIRTLRVVRRHVTGQAGFSP
ncbi:IS4 family transposase [Nocardia abscessus]|uniref:IS4 family transposase n=1 Tax=Nocardia abscessus TaxID=120957 RepID=UPI001D13BFC6|nr:IS4 family transposase [Nocardia abscessus]MCC3332039.1 IS4 family transposase [Nocardia abscessus]